ncbi:ATP-binding protein [Paraburkholderia phenazinium]|uniref:ATP-binding protein n=1 Tax=Paraburkholderia phenazinium TaxID=60549 RepID=UPI00158D3598|nr:ATP-binding protein [Paraburkholderia phenazinium]
MKKLDLFDLVRQITYEERLKYSKLTREQVFALSDRQKVRYFFSLRVKHRLRDAAEDKLAGLLGPDTDTGIFTLFGPTGTGKTALAEALGAQLKSTDLGQRPFIFVSAPAFGTAKVSWTGFFRSVLEAGDEPMIDDKRTWSVANGNLLGSGRRADLPAFRNAVRSMLKNRRTQLLAIDEILHILRFGDFEAIMDTLKSLSDAVTCQLLLIGPYELFDMVTSYGQVIRRGEMIHLGRYRCDRVNEKEGNGSDIGEYRKIIEKLMSRWPLQNAPNFHAVAADLLEATLGVVGLLKDFLTRCLILQICNSGEWKGNFVSEALKKAHSINKIREEIHAGEAMLIRQHFDEPVIEPQRLRHVEDLTTRTAK